MTPFRLVLALGSTLLLAGVLAAPWLPVLYLPFAPVCHQIAAKSFHLHGLPLAVCARCAGIYAGLAAAVCFRPPVRPIGIWVLLALNAFDAAFGLSGNASRCLLGFLAAWFAAGWLLTRLASRSQAAGH